MYTGRYSVLTKTILVTTWMAVPQPHLSCSISDRRDVQAIPERGAIVAEIQQAHSDCTRGLSRQSIPQTLQLFWVCALALQEAAVPAQHLIPAGAARYGVCSGPESCSKKDCALALQDLPDTWSLQVQQDIRCTHDTAWIDLKQVQWEMVPSPCRSSACPAAALCGEHSVTQHRHWPLLLTQ